MLLGRGTSALDPEGWVGLAGRSQWCQEVGQLHVGGMKYMRSSGRKIFRSERNLISDERHSFFGLFELLTKSPVPIPVPMLPQS